MFGIAFRGHPDLRRILMPEEYEGLPQRRDFPIGGEPVLFTHNEHEMPAVVRVSEREPRRKRARAGHRRDARPARRPLEAARRGRPALDDAGREEEILTINFGPHHPATHGVLRLLVTLEGEVVRDMKPYVGYVHTGHREELRGQVLLEGDPAGRADGLPRLLLQCARLLHGGRAAARRAGAGARAVPAGDPLRAEPDPLAPGLARHLGARPRRDLDLLVLLPRARQGARPVRGLLRPADAHPLLPGGRRVRGHPGRLGPQGAGVRRRHGASASTSTRRCSTATRSSSSGPRASASCPQERLLELGVTGPLLRAAGNPWDLRKADALQLLRPLRLQGPDRHRRRLLRPLPRAGRRDPRVLRDHPPGGRGPARRARTSPTTARSRCRPGTSSRPRWRR